MNQFLDRTFSVRQALTGLAGAAILLAAAYLALVLRHAWHIEYGGVGYRDSPYADLVPLECRKSAALAGRLGMPFPAQTGIPRRTLRDLTVDELLLQPTGYVYSLSAAETKLGRGMRGLPCMGYDFLVRLHGPSFVRKDRYVNQRGELIATVTTEVVRSYREPLPHGQWIDPWSEITSPPAGDASLPIAKN